MEDARRVRTLGIIGGVNNGKTTLVNLVVSPTSHDNSGFLGPNMTIKATPLSIRFGVDSNSVISSQFGKEFLINFIDSPGHLDLIAEVNAALQIVDGALLVVDCSLDSDLHTETILRRVLMEKIRPALVINKFDIPLLEKDAEKEAIYQSLKRTIDNLNATISSFSDSSLGDAQLFPERGNVAFTSGLYGWGFALRQFARRYAKQFGIDEETILRKLWGESYFDSTTQKWTNTSTDADGEPLERAFNMFVLDPILKIANAVATSNRKVLDAILNKLGLQLSDQDQGLEGNDLLNAVMRNFLPAGEPLLEMIVTHLPSPSVAQRYRVETVYEGPMDDEFAVGIRECHPLAPLVLYVSKMIPSSEKGRFYALGRVFSGSISAGCKVRVQGPNYQPGNSRKDDLYSTTIEEVLAVVGRSFVRADRCVAGNIVVLHGVDKFLLKSGTITTYDNTSNIRALKPTMSPVQVTVEVKRPIDLPLLVEGLQQLSKSDSGIQTWVTETGEHIVAGTGEVHLETCLKDLQGKYTNGLPLQVSPPTVSYRETVTAESSTTVLVKSQNKHNRLYAKASPLGEDLARAIENGIITSRDDFKARARVLEEEYRWGRTEARKIWCFGPDTTDPNVLVDVTRGVQYLHEIKDSSIAAFRWATKEGVLCEEKMRGLRVKIIDVSMLNDAIHRGGGQIIPTMRRAVYGASLLAQPTIQEPMYLVEVKCPETDLTLVRFCLQRRRARIVTEEQHQGPKKPTMYTIKASLPILESFGFHAEVDAISKGRASVGMTFDKWECIPGSPYEPGSKVETLILEIRRQKGLPLQIPPPGSFVDRL